MTERDVTVDDVIAWYKDEMAKRAAAESRAAASDALARRLLAVLPPPERLRVLARWLDLLDEERVIWRRSRSGGPGTEVQEDLRRWATEIDGVQLSDEASDLLARSAEGGGDG